MDGHKQVGHQFHAHAIPKVTHVIAHACKACKYSMHGFDGFGVAAGIDGQVAAQRLRACARKRAVQQGDAAPRQCFFMAHFAGLWQGAGVCRNQAFVTRGEQL